MIKQMTTDANGQKILTIYYPNAENVFSYEFRYGTAGYNNAHDYMKIVAVPVTVAGVTPIWSS